MILVRPHQNGDKGWRAVWMEPQPDGTKVRRVRHIGDVTKAKAQRVCADIQRELDESPLAAPSSLSAWSRRFFECCGSLSEDTEGLYTLTFTRLLEHFGDVELGEVTDADARSFLTYLEALRKPDGTALSSSSINRHLRDARRIWAIAVEAKLCRENPFASAAAREGRAKHKVGVAFTRYVPLSELAMLLAACPNESWRLVFQVARLAGLRRNEIERLEWGNIDLQARTITVEGDFEDGASREGTKKRRRVVPVVPELYEVLANHPSRTGLLVDVPTDNFERAARGIVTASGVEFYGKPLHALRAAFENDMMDRHPIQDVAEWLGHSVEVAMRHYRQRERVSRIDAATRIPLSEQKRTPDAHKIVDTNRQVLENTMVAGVVQR
jgi:integrase